MEIKGYQLQSIEFIGSGGPWWKTRCPDGSVALSCLFAASEAQKLKPRWKRWAEVNNPHVVALIDLVEHQDGRCLVVEEWVQGQSLESFLTTGQPPTVTASWYDQIAEGLQAWHRAGLIHGDLSPANVVIAEDGHAVVVDVATDPSQCQGTPGWSQGGAAGMEGDRASMRRLANALGIDEERPRVPDSSAAFEQPNAHAQVPSAVRTWRALAEATPTVMTQSSSRWKPKIVVFVAVLVVAGVLPWGLYATVGAKNGEEKGCTSTSVALEQLNSVLAKRDQAIMSADPGAIEAVSSGSVAADDRELVKRLADAKTQIKALKTQATQIKRVTCDHTQMVVEAAIRQHSATRCESSRQCRTVPPQPEHWLTITLGTDPLRVLSIEALEQE